MLHNTEHDFGYVIEARGVAIKVNTVEQVVDLVRNLTIAEAPPVPAPRDLSGAIEAIMRDGRPRTPTEVMHALLAQGFKPSEATYNRVYAALRYGEFEKDGGRWTVAA